MNSFSLDVKAFADSFEQGSEKAVRGTAIKLFSSFVDTSPVDEGRFRANWFATGAKPSVKITNNIDKNGEKTKKQIESVVLGLQDWSIFTATNNLPYGPLIEFGGYPDPVKKGTYNKATKSYEKRSKAGYSKQSPNGVIRVNVMRFNRLLTLEAKKNLPK